MRSCGVCQSELAGLDELLADQDSDPESGAWQIGPLPSLLSQTNQDFAWVITVDPALPEADRAALERLTANRHHTYIETTEANGTPPRWLDPDATPPAPGDLLLTTSLEVDAALPRTFVAELHAAVRARAEAAPTILLGATETTTWDLALHPRSPRGLAFVAPEDSIRSLGHTGLTIATRQPGTDPSEDTPPNPFDAPDPVVDLTPAVGPVLSINAALNRDRLRRDRNRGRVVAGPVTFPAFTLGWHALDRHAARFRVRRWERPAHLAYKTARILNATRTGLTTAGSRLATLTRRT